jgi:antitoxin VapB
MGLSIKNDETERLIRQLAKARNTSITRAVTEAVRNELSREARSRKDPEAIIAAVRKIQAEVAKLPVLMTDEEVDAWMYDENGLPH